MIGVTVSQHNGLVHIWADDIQIMFPSTGTATRGDGMSMNPDEFSQLVQQIKQGKYDDLIAPDVLPCTGNHE